MIAKLSLTNIIFKVINKDASFFDLEKPEQRKVLDFIKSNNLNLKIFRRKWYDVLSSQFYAEEFVADQVYSSLVKLEKKSFDCFGDFYEYVNGAIYDDRSCFYGYDFSSLEISKYSLQISKINFCCLIKDRIDNYSLSKLLTEKEKEQTENLYKTTKLVNWFIKRGRIKTIRSLENKQKEFSNIFGYSYSEDIFTSFALRKNKYNIKEAAIQYATTHDDIFGISFIHILMNYGEDAALKVIENCAIGYSYSTNNRRVKKFKAILDAYKNGSLKLCRKFGYSEHLCLYYVYDRYSAGDNYICVYNNYFESFKEFTSFVNNDLSSADLSRAPISSDEVYQFQTNSQTKLPLSLTYKTLRLTKKYFHNEFVVNQEWLNDEGVVVLNTEHSFDIFFDFVYFLNSDLSNADLLFCEGLENIKKINNLNLTKVKVRSDIADKIGVTYKLLPKNNPVNNTLLLSSQYEMTEIENSIIEHSQDEYGDDKVSYIADIHLLHRFNQFKCRSCEDIEYVSKTIVQSFIKETANTLLIAGDTSSDFNVFQNFLKDLASYSYGVHFFFVLGNHELWPFGGYNLPQVISKYKDTLKEANEKRFHLVHNNLYYRDENWREISEEELESLTKDALREKTRGAKLIIFGGIGFAGTNDEFNAENHIYLDALDRQKEIEESKRFFGLYEKVTNALYDKNLIILTHMPLKDWGGVDSKYKKGIVYVSGHNHKNYFFDDSVKRIYADNQVGYKGKSYTLKHIYFDFVFDWFADYKDGIYEITRDDYLQFYRGWNESITFNREFKKLYLLKKEKSYLFMVEEHNGSLYVLNGGAVRKSSGHSIQYFYENLSAYSKAVNSFLSEYINFQKNIASEIKKIGGTGRIHGCIVDIDFYNHLYLNPLDGTITPYHAYSIIDKYVYENIPSLLRYECPALYSNYENSLKGEEKKVLLFLNGTFKISKRTKYIDDTEIYRLSRIIKGLQFTCKYNIVRLWNDAYLTMNKEEVGKLIFKSIINQGLPNDDKLKSILSTKDE